MKDRAFFTVAETAQYLGRKPNTIREWLRSGRASGVLFLVHGCRVSRVLLAEEVDRLRRLELPAPGERPGWRGQVLWDRMQAKAKKGAAARWCKPRVPSTVNQDQDHDTNPDVCLACVNGQCTAHQGPSD